MSSSLRPHGLQHARHPCPSTTPGVYSNSCPLSQWCHPTISSSVFPYSSHLQSFPASGSFQMSQLFTWVGQSVGVSSSTSVLPMNIQDWFPLGWTDWISLQSKGLSRVLFNTTVQKYHFFGAQLALQFLYINKIWRTEFFIPKSQATYFLYEIFRKKMLNNFICSLSWSLFLIMLPGFINLLKKFMTRF